MPIVNNDKVLVGDLFSERNPFVIPIHQRSYSWEIEDVESFCDDLLSINLSDNEEEYFFGGIVSVFEHAPNGPGKLYKVVDGQQRLTTFTLYLLCIYEALRKLMEDPDASDDDKSYAKDISDDLKERYIVYKDTSFKPAKVVNRLTLSQIDREFFNSLIKSEILPITSISHKRIIDAKNTIYNKIVKSVLDNDKNVAEKIEELQSKSKLVLDKSVIIHVVTNDLDDAFQLFEVLNDRGKDLAIGDYLRSSTLNIVTNNDEAVNRISQAWDKVLSCESADKFIKNYLSSHIGAIKRTNVHRQFRKNFFDNINGEQRDTVIINRIENMAAMNVVHEKISNGIWPYESSTIEQWKRHRLTELVKTLNHSHCIPFLMSMYETVSEVDFSELVLALEKFVFRFISVGNQRPNKLSQVYYSSIIKARKNEFEIESFISNLRTLINLNYS